MKHEIRREREKKKKNQQIIIIILLFSFTIRAKQVKNMLKGDEDITIARSRHLLI